MDKYLFFDILLNAQYADILVNTFINTTKVPYDVLSVNPTKSHVMPVKLLISLHTL